jgi:hypothetical protein
MSAELDWEYQILSNARQWNLDRGAEAQSMGRQSEARRHFNNVAQLDRKVKSLTKHH